MEKKKIPQSPLKVSWLGPPIGLKEWVSLAGHKGALLDNEGGELHAPASSLAELRRQWLLFCFFLWINVAGGVAYWKTRRCSSSTGSCSKPEPRINRFPTGSQYLIFLPLAAPIFDRWSRWPKEKVEDEEEEEAGLTPAQRCWSPPRQSASSRTAWRRTGRAAGPGGWSRCGLCSDDHIGPIQDWSSLKKLRSS